MSTQSNSSTHSLIHHYGWHEWLCHTNFSFLKGASHPKHLVQRAIEGHYHSLTITDYDGVYGCARTYLVLKKLQQLGTETHLKIHCGAEIHLSPDHDLPLYYQDTLALVVLTHEGYFNLCKLLSLSHRDGKKDAWLPLESLLECSVEGLVAIQPMRGKLRQGLSDSDSEWLERVDALKAHFQDRWYWAISRHLNPAEDCWIPQVLDMAQRSQDRVLLSQDIFFHEPSQKRVHDVLQAIRLNQPLSEISEHLFVNSRRYPHRLESLERLYGELPVYEQALHDSAELAQSIQFELGQLRYHYPKEMIPSGFTPQSYLEHLVWEHALKRYGNPVPEKICNLLMHELHLVQALQFADYFLTVYDIVTWARQHNILCQGRGSAANSAICFVLGITAVSPDQVDLLFERFVSLERGDPPDIDVDFEHERREEVIQYIYERYGRDRAAMVANVITFRSKGAMRFTGKALGIPEPILSQASDLLKARAFRGSELSEVVTQLQHDLGEKAAEVSDLHWKLWPALAAQVIGFPRHLGIHSGGFVVADKPLHWLCPQEPATMEGRTVIQWCKEDIEGLGFFKIDILALGMLTALRKMFELLYTYYGRKIDLASIPQDDTRTYEMIQKADTVGVFQIESRAQMGFLPRHKPVDFYDLVVQVAIIRPGPLQGGMVHPYIRRRFGLEKPQVPDKRLEPILRRTYGIPIFQEQVMRVAMAVGGFTPGEANEIRKNLGAFNFVGNVDLWIGKLADGMRNNGISEQFIQEILGQMKGFASYGFPESHAASFASLAYVSAYVKCHYPLAFYLALLNSQPMGFYRPDTLIKSAQQVGIRFLPICVNHSRWDHHLEQIDSEEWTPVYAIRLGMRLVQGLSQNSVECLVACRDEQGPWATIEQFAKAALLNRLELTALAAADALSVLGLERKSALWAAAAAPFADLLEPKEDPIDLPPESEMEAVQLDYQATSTSLGRHPSELMKEHVWCFPVPLDQLVNAAQIKTLSANQWVHLFGMVTCRQSPGTAKGMVFITLWDETGSIDLAVQPHVYLKYRQLIDGQAFLCLSGRYQQEQGAGSILVQVVYAPMSSTADVLPYPPQPQAALQEGIPLPTEEFELARNYR